MVSVAEASDIVFSNLFHAITEKVTIQKAVGRVLGEVIKADRDFPPFNRVAMDGIAIAFESWTSGQREFIIESIQAAGQPQQVLSNKQQAFEVMTGAMLPLGADTVIRYEDVAINNGKATIKIDDIRQGQHVHKQGTDARKDGILLEPGVVISPAEIALMASVGKGVIDVYNFPRAAIISSGNELVSIEQTPAPFEIRRSNTHALEAAMRLIGWSGYQYHLRDDKESIVSSLLDVLSKHDVIIISGGVSKGKFDFMPEALETVGVKKLFHQVNQRPGKPFWFGCSPLGKIVFALPGNPVSTYMCFYRYILPWLWKSLHVEKETQYAVLANDFKFQPAITHFLQVSVKNQQGKLMAYPDAGGGSGDFANLKKVDGFLELPADQSEFKTGSVFPYYAFR
jgi:molybdopterin molybdotransferase